MEEMPSWRCPTVVLDVCNCAWMPVHDRVDPLRCFELRELDCGFRVDVRDSHA